MSPNQKRAVSSGGRRGSTSICPAQIADAAQVSLALFSHICHQHGSQRRILERSCCGPCRRQGQQRRQSRSVIRNSRPQQPSIPVDLDVLGRPRRQHRVQVRRHRDRGRVFALSRQPRNHVARPVQLRFPAQRAEPLRHILRAPLLEERRRRNPAQLEMLFVDPRAFLAKPVEAGAHPCGASQIGNGFCQRRHGNSSLAARGRNPGRSQTRPTGCKRPAG